MIACAAVLAQGPLRTRRRSLRGVSFGSYGISGLNRSSACPAQSPASAFAGNIDSPAGQVALAQPCLRDGAHALQFRRVRARPVLALHFRTSHGARARHLRLSQAAVTSDGHPAVGAQWAAHLHRLGSAARRLSALGEAAERRCDVASPCGRGCGAQAVGEARCVARFCGSRRTRADEVMCGVPVRDPKKMTTGTLLYLCMALQW